MVLSMQYNKQLCTCRKTQINSLTSDVTKIPCQCHNTILSRVDMSGIFSIHIFTLIHLFLSVLTFGVMV